MSQSHSKEDVKYEMDMRRLDWRKDWPQSEEELKEILKQDGLIEYLEERGIYLRCDEKTGKVTITKKKI